MKKLLIILFSMSTLTISLLFFITRTTTTILDDTVPGGSISIQSSGSTTYVTHLDSTPIFTAQASTGVYASTNCAPTSLFMVLKWLGQTPSSVSQLRNELTGNSGWIYTPEIENYLSNKEIPYQTIYLGSTSTFINTLNDGILLVCLDISKISPAASLTPPTNLSPLLKELPVGKESSSGTGHFVVATGYFIQDGVTYIEMLDPLNSGIRYYQLDELFQSVKDWYNYLYLFTK
ncbi:MAG: C39 family peptidase [Cellulosilyticaceae bacterium]